MEQACHFFFFLPVLSTHVLPFEINMFYTKQAPCRLAWSYHTKGNRRADGHRI